MSFDEFLKWWPGQKNIHKKFQTSKSQLSRGIEG